MEIDPVVPDQIVVVRDFLTDAACRDWIAWSESRGYEAARLSDGSYRTEVRDNDRLIIDDPPLAAAWFDRIRVALPALPSATAVGLNERFRFYRYRPGQRFRHHTDGVYRRDTGEFSHFTLLVYLNDDFDGGQTSFTRWAVPPRTGAALLFQHRIEHAGEAVSRGTKYVLRTDVMYRRRPDPP